MTKYIGLTIGPIYKTILRAEKTQELWGASYFFSYLMKNIIKRIMEKYKDSSSFIIPYVNDPKIFDTGKEVGLFHDRFICEITDGSLSDLHQDIIGPLLFETSQKMIEKLDVSVCADDVYNYLKKYLNIYYCEIDSANKTNEINKDINSYLDVLELRSKFIPHDKSDYLMSFLKGVNNSFLTLDALNVSRQRFYSIPEIAAKELDFTGIDTKIEKEDSDIFKELKKVNGDKFKTYHKYIAIVQADGDDLGETIKGLTQESAFKDFSKALFGFALDAHKIIKDNGGATIYAGGDDLLFFAPVIFEGSSVFDICHKLGNCFRDKMAEALGKDENLPTLSFGVSISYYKYPMYEALGEAQNLLFEKAKKFKGKNAIAFTYLKHSGTYFNGTLSRNSEIYLHFRKLIGYDLKKDILTSVIHNILNYRTILLEIGHDHQRLKYFFENQYNEDIHKGLKGFFESVTAFIYEVCCTCKYSEDEKINLIYSVLRLKKNLKGEEDR